MILFVFFGLFLLVVVYLIRSESSYPYSRVELSATAKTKSHFKALEEHWRTVANDKTLKSRIVTDESRYLTNPNFVRNLTRYGKNSKNGELIGMLNGVRIYLK